MPSNRLSWSVSENRFSRELRRLRAEGAPLIDLTDANPTAVGFVYPHEEIAAAIGGLRDFTYAPEPLGLRSAREAIVAYYAGHHVVVGSDHIALTASTSEAYGYLFKLLCNPDDEILIPTPSYPLFEYLAALENVRAIPYHLRYDGSWHIDWESVRSALSSRTKALVLVNPNNPTGSHLKVSERELLVELAREHDLALISDEVFVDYPLEPASGVVRTLAGDGEVLTFVLGGLSKCAGMPQMKLGWIVVNGPESRVNESREQLAIVLDTYLSVGTPVQRALPELLRIGVSVQRQIHQRARRNLLAINNILAGAPANALFTEGGWSAVIQLPRTRPEDDWLLGLLTEQHTIAQPGYFFDMPGEPFCVISLITPEPAFDEGLLRLRKVLQGE